MQRYRFYREHKYVSHELNQLERKIAVCDFRKQSEVDAVQEQFVKLKMMLEFHADHENTGIHALLRIKGSQLYEQCEKEHEEQHLIFAEIMRGFSIFEDLEKTDEERLKLGHELYLFFRKFLAEMLLHLDYEETLMMPELQRLYTDEELGSVDAKTYEIMTPEEMIDMLDVLSPHMNASDREFFLEDIRRTQVGKYSAMSAHFDRS